MNNWINLIDKIPDNEKLILVFIPSNREDEMIFSCKFIRSIYKEHSAIPIPYYACSCGNSSEQFFAFKEFVWWLPLPNPPEIKS
jgi:hypothetical protein